MGRPDVEAFLTWRKTHKRHVIVPRFPQPYGSGKAERFGGQSAVAAFDTFNIVAGVNSLHRNMLFSKMQRIEEE